MLRKRQKKSVLDVINCNITRNRIDQLFSKMMAPHIEPEWSVPKVEYDWGHWGYHMLWRGALLNPNAVIEINLNDVVTNEE